MKPQFCSKRSQAVALIYDMTVAVNKPLLPTQAKLESAFINILDARTILRRQQQDKFDTQLEAIQRSTLDIKTVSTMAIIYQKEYFRMLQQKSREFLVYQDVYSLNALTKSAQEELQKQWELFSNITIELRETDMELTNLLLQIVQEQGQNPCTWMFDASDNCRIYRNLEEAEDNLKSTILLIGSLHSDFSYKFGTLHAALSIPTAIICEEDTYLINQMLTLPPPVY